MCAYGDELGGLASADWGPTPAARMPPRIAPISTPRAWRPPRPGSRSPLPTRGLDSVPEWPSTSSAVAGDRPQVDAADKAPRFRTVGVLPEGTAHDRPWSAPNRDCEEIIVSEPDFHQHKGDLAKLRQCHIPRQRMSPRPTDQPSHTYGYIFEQSCRSSVEIRDPWQGIANPEHVRGTSEQDMTINQVWIPNVPSVSTMEFDDDLIDSPRLRASSRRTASSQRRRSSGNHVGAPRPRAQSEDTPPGRLENRAAPRKHAATPSEGRPRGRDSGWPGTSPGHGELLPAAPGADMAESDNGGNRPLHSAARAGSQPTYRHQLQLRADPKFADKYSNHPLEEASGGPSAAQHGGVLAAQASGGPSAAQQSGALAAQAGGGRGGASPRAPSPRPSPSRDSHAPGGLLPSLPDRRTGDPSPGPSEHHVEHTSCAADRATPERPPADACLSGPTIAWRSEGDARAGDLHTQVKFVINRPRSADRAALPDGSPDASFCGLPDIASPGGADVGKLPGSSATGPTRSGEQPLLADLDDPAAAARSGSTDNEDTAAGTSSSGKFRDPSPAKSRPRALLLRGTGGRRFRRTWK